MYVSSISNIFQSLPARFSLRSMELASNRLHDFGIKAPLPTAMEVPQKRWMVYRDNPKMDDDLGVPPMTKRKPPKHGMFTEFAAMI